MGSPSAPVYQRPVLSDEQREGLIGRLRGASHLEPEVTDRRRGAGGGPPPPRGGNSKPAEDSKIIANVSLLSEDKSAFRQWDAKLTNALSHLPPGYGKSSEKLQEIIGQGRHPEAHHLGA